MSLLVLLKGHGELSSGTRVFSTDSFFSVEHGCQVSACVPSSAPLDSDSYYNIPVDLLGEVRARTRDIKGLNRRERRSKKFAGV